MHNKTCEYLCFAAVPSMPVVSERDEESGAQWVQRRDVNDDNAGSKQESRVEGGKTIR